MANHFEQSTPPSIHDVYRGLPIGPGGVEPFIFRDRGRHRRGPAHLPWRQLFHACKRAFRHALEAWQRIRSGTPGGRSADATPNRPSAGTCR